MVYWQCVIVALTRASPMSWSGLISFQYSISIIPFLPPSRMFCSRLLATPYDSYWYHAVRYVTHDDVFWHHYLWRRMTSYDSSCCGIIYYKLYVFNYKYLVVAVVRLQSWLRLYLAQYKALGSPLNFCLYLAVKASSNPLNSLTTCWNVIRT